MNQRLADVVASTRSTDAQESVAPVLGRFGTGSRSLRSSSCGRASGVQPRAITRHGSTVMGESPYLCALGHTPPVASDRQGFKCFHRCYAARFGCFEAALTRPLLAFRHDRYGADWVSVRLVKAGRRDVVLFAPERGSPSSICHDAAIKT
jgi:hypothetical protein